VKSSQFSELSFFPPLLKLREKELRAAHDGLTEEELEIFDLLKKDKLIKKKNKA
jgi:hypothetical protein